MADAVLALIERGVPCPTAPELLEPGTQPHADGQTGGWGAPGAAWGGQVDGTPGDGTGGFGMLGEQPQFVEFVQPAMIVSSCKESLDD